MITSKELSKQAYMLYFRVRECRWDSSQPSVRRERLDALLVPLYLRFERRQTLAGRHG